MSLFLRGVGTALPATRLPQADAEGVARVLCTADADEAAAVRALYRQTGIANRHIVIDGAVARDILDGTRHTGSPFLPDPADPHGPSTSERMAVYAAEALPLAEAAARRALADADEPPAAVTHLVTVSCTGFVAPGFDVGLMRRLGLSPEVQRTHVGFMGCHGALNGLRAARAYADADPAACVLLCAAELCSVHYHYGYDPKRMVANALFADGAGAVVGRSAGGAADWRLTASGSCLFPESEWAMTWAVGDHGFAMTLSAKVPNLIAAHLRPWLAAWLGRHGQMIEGVRSWAVHPGGPRVLREVERALGIAEGSTAVSREVLAECGNMSSPTVLFIAERLRRAGAPLPCVAVGFGPGLVAEAALFE